MDYVLEILYAHFSPGTLTLILAVVAAMSALPKIAEWIKDSWVAHAVVMFVFFSIASAEGLVIRHADKAGEERIRELNGKVIEAVNNTTEIQNTLTGYIKAQNVYDQARIEIRASHKVSDELLELKGRVANLSSNIFQFLLERSVMSPPIPRPSTWEQDIAKLAPFDNETVLIYEQRFEADVRRSIEDLSKHGLKDDRLEMFGVEPHNMIGIRIVANHLAAQAERITPDGVKPLTRILMP